MEIPKTQKALYITERNADLHKVQVEIKTDVAVPTPKYGQVLIRVVAAPLNPSDYGTWIRPASENDTPTIGGMEGSGVVVSSGGGFTANGMIGKKVGFVKPKQGGAYQQYVIVDASEGAFPLPANVKVEDAASHFVNPYTVCGFVDTLRRRHTTDPNNNHPIGMVHTAAASQVGQMLLKLALEENINIINVVRKDEQVELLKSLGAKHIIKTTSNDEWEAELGSKMKELGINVVFDAVGGDMSGKLLGLLPDGGSHFAYGRLGGTTCNNVNFLDISYKKKKFEGWYLANWLLEYGKSLTTLQRINAATAKVHRGLVEGGWSASTYQDCKLEDLWDTFLANMVSEQGVTGRKLRIRFDQ